MGQTVEFKVGDEVEWIGGDDFPGCGNLLGDLRNKVIGKITVTSIEDSMMSVTVVDRDGNALSGNKCCQVYTHLFKKVSSSHNIMSKLTILAKKTFDADTRLFIKAGILDESLEITDLGTKFLLAQYLSDNKVALAKEAKKLVDEQEAEKE